MEVYSCEDMIEDIGGDEDKLRLMILGDAKVGKTYTVIKTAVQPIFVINCDRRSALRGAVRDGLKFTASPVISSPKEMDTALKMARFLIKEEGYETILWDTLTVYFANTVKQILASNTNTQRAWGDIGDTVIAQVNRFLDLPAHSIINAHYQDEHEELDGESKRKAQHGKVPLLQGRSKKVVPGLLDDIIFMKRTLKGRKFVTGEDGVYGIGGRSTNQQEMKANVKTFMRAAGMLPPLAKAEVG